MRRLGHYVASAVVSLSLIATSTAAAASAPPPVTPAAQFDPWAVLSVMSGGAPAAAVCGSAAAAATAQPAGGCVLPQVGVAPPVPVETPAAVPPPVAVYAAGMPTPPIPVLLVWAAVLATMVYLATKSNHHPVPISPA